MRRTASLLAIPVAFMLVWFAPGARSDWRDTGVGVALVALGAATAVVDVRSFTGPLLAAAGCTWFFGNFVASTGEWTSAFGSRNLFLHRALLATAAIAVVGRPKRTAWPLFTVVYVLALWPTAMRSGLGSGVWAALVVVWVLVEVGRRPGADKIARAGSLTAGSLVAAVVALRLYGSQYQFGIVASGVVAASGAVTVAWGHARLTDRVIDRLHHSHVTMRAAFAHALGDEAVVVAFADGDGWTDEAGHPVTAPVASAGRHLTIVDIRERARGAVVHDVALLEDPEMTLSVRRAARLASEHVLLRSDVRRATEQAIASRRRVLAAASAARAGFAADFRRGPGAQLAAVESELAGVELQRDVAAIRRAIDDLLEGLGPLASAGGRLVPALRSLVSRSAVQVDLRIDDGVDPAGVAAETLWYVCAEGLNNVAKHSGCEEASVRVFRDRAGPGLEVADDGRGGAAVTRGSGLQGLRDRVTAVGGTFAITSSAAGTRLVAVVPEASLTD